MLKNYYEKYIRKEEENMKKITKILMMMVLVVSMFVSNVVPPLLVEAQTGREVTLSGKSNIANQATVSVIGNVNGAQTSWKNLTDNDNGTLFVFNAGAMNNEQSVVLNYETNVVMDAFRIVFESVGATDGNNFKFEYSILAKNRDGEYETIVSHATANRTDNYIQEYKLENEAIYSEVRIVMHSCKAGDENGWPAIAEFEVYGENYIELELGESMIFKGELSSAGDDPSVISSEEMYGKTYSRVTFGENIFEDGNEGEFLIVSVKDNFQIMKDIWYLTSAVTDNNGTINGNFSEYLWTVEKVSEERNETGELTGIVCTIKDKNGNYLEILHNDHKYGIGIRKTDAPPNLKIEDNSTVEGKAHALAIGALSLIHI